MKIFTTFFFLIIHSFIYSQKYDLINGDTIHLENENYSTKVIGRDAENFYLLTLGEKQYLQKVRLRDAKFLYEIVLNEDKDYFKVDGVSDYSILKIEVVNRKILCFVDFTKGTDRTLTVFEYDVATGDLLGKPRELHKLSSIGYQKDAVLKANLGYVGFKVSFSPDKKSVVIVDEKKKNNAEPEVMASCYNTNGFEKIWEKQLIKVYNNSAVSTSDYLISDDGNLYFLLSYLRGAENKEDGIYAIGIINEAENETKVIPLSANNRSNTQLNLVWHENKIICHGKFVDGQNEALNGRFVEKCGFLFVCLNPVTMKIEAGNYDYTQAYFFSPGSALYNYDYVSTLTIKGSIYVIHKFNGSNIADGGIAICKYNEKNLQLEWMKRINRDCVAYNGYGGDRIKGFNFLVKDDKLVFLYNEHKKNIKNFPDVNEIDPVKYKTLQMETNAVLVCTTLNEQGQLYREVVQKTQKIFVGGSNEELLWIQESNKVIVQNYITKDKRSYSILTIKD